MAKILVIDDSRFQRNCLIQALASLGHESAQACDGLEGLEKIKQEQYDCVTLDLLMPRMDGTSLLRILRDEKIVTPAIVVSSDIQVETRRECEALGCAGFVNKPFNPNELQAAIDRCLTGSGTEEEKHG